MRVLIAGGGTGGHLFPGMALAERFNERREAEQILFVGTRNPLEKSTLVKKGFNHVGIQVEGLKGRGLWQQIRALAKLPKGFLQAVSIIRRHNPDIIIGVGGYASGPVALAARLMRKKLIIHEQNLLPGFTNRLLGRFAHRIFVSFPDEQAVFNESKTLVTGNPVRRELLSAPQGRTTSGNFTVLVTGGSQGAHAVNAAVLEALNHLKEPSGIDFIHQTGSKDEAWVARTYENRGIRATVQAFFHDMATVYSSADLIICRAGATTVAELTALGKPAIFIPFPFATNNHQEFNARYVSDSGGAEVILEKNLNGALLAQRIEYYAANPKVVQDMSRRSRALGRPDAADIIVDECRRVLLMNCGS